MGSSIALNPNAREYYPRGYVSSLQAPPISITFHPHNPIRFLPPPPPPPVQPPSSFFIHHLPHSSPPPPPLPSAPLVHDRTHLPRVDTTWSARRWWLGHRAHRQGGRGSRGGLSRQLRRGCDRRSRDSERTVSEEMRKMRIVEQRDVSRRRKPVVPVKSDADITTVMIRNIPNKYTRDLLIEFLDNHCKVENEKAEESENDASPIVSAYDFVYLPLDFRRKANLGYAFVNFTDPRAVWRFHTSKNNQYWEFFSSNKIREVATAKLQGKEQLLKRFENTLFACESDEFLPVAFSPPRDGTNNKSITQRTVGMHK